MVQSSETQANSKRPWPQKWYLFPDMAMILPHAVYAEDQPYARTILTIHCLHRGFTSGAILGMVAPFARSAFNTISRRPAPVYTVPFTSRLLSSAAAGSIGGTVFTAFGMTARMWGREEIEWKDRSWRLLANDTQNAEDGNSVDMMVAGALIGVFATRRGGSLAKEVTGASRSRMIVGGAAVGSVFGTLFHLMTSSRSGEEVKDKIAAGAEGLQSSTSTT
ncbi:MAG: hypothetical protein Q9218_004336 [Villophora microphyllina]